MKPRILMLTRLFPSRIFHTNGTFCEQRAKQLHKFADLRVMTPTPYFWGMPYISKSWKEFSRVEKTAIRPDGTYVTYPRYISIPKTATWLQGFSMARSVKHEHKKYHRRWHPDLIDAHFAFPDGFAAVKLAKKIGCPVQITCHGSDLECYTSVPIAGKMLIWALKNADRIICVSDHLKDKCLKLGIDEKNCVVLPNAVDTNLFNIQDKDQCREKLDLDLKTPTVLCIGRLAFEKNQLVLLHALADLKKHRYQDLKLLLVGDGPLLSKLIESAHKLGISDDVVFAGNVPYEDIPTWINAADWVVLSSIREGWPAVYYEAQACGKPVITSNVSAAHQAISDPSMGIIVSHNTSIDFSEAFIQAIHSTFDHERIRQNAMEHTWEMWAKQFREICNFPDTPPTYSKAG